MQICREQQAPFGQTIGGLENNVEIRNPFSSWKEGDAGTVHEEEKDTVAYRHSS